MPFNHSNIKFNIELNELNKKNVNGVRTYITPSKNLYPSVTTILGDNKKEFFKEWRKKVGPERAAYAANRGTHYHKLIEMYLDNHTNEDIKNYFLDINDKYKSGALNLFIKTIPLLDSCINNIVLQEYQLFSDTLKTAGTVDCLAEYNGILSVIDFKSAGKPKVKRWIGDYFLQTTAYSIMIQELTGIEIKQNVIIVADDKSLNVEPFVFNPKNYEETLYKRLIEYYKNNPQMKNLKADK